LSNFSCPVNIETKNQWARDDPAFIVIEAAFVAIAALAYAIAFRHPSFWGYLWTVLYCVIVDWLLIGFIVASTCRWKFLFISNLIV
jgi:hypothetical protein